VNEGRSEDGKDEGLDNATYSRRQTASKNQYRFSNFRLEINFVGLKQISQQKGSAFPLALLISPTTKRNTPG
jgi:hypothetical protein